MILFCFSPNTFLFPSHHHRGTPEQAANLNVEWRKPCQLLIVCHGELHTSPKNNQKSFFTRYMPQNPSDPKETCRSLHKTWKHSSLQKQLFSVKNARKFLRNMKDASGSKCDCLPDCELTDLQHSLATTDFMWVTSIGWSVDKTRCLKWIKQHTESHVSPGHVTRATLTWTLSACWKLVLIPNFGQTGLKLSLS